MRRRRRGYRTEEFHPTHSELGNAREERPGPNDDTRCLRRRRK